MPSLVMDRQQNIHPLLLNNKRRWYKVYLKVKIELSIKCNEGNIDKKNYYYVVFIPIDYITTYWGHFTNKN